MHLAKLTIEGFRKIKSLDLAFQRGLNVLVGENNVGKTAVLDALRALLSTEDGGLRIEDSDFHVDSSGVKATLITFRFVFHDLTEEQEADFITALKLMPPAENQPQKYEVQLSVQYALPPSGGRARPKRWCGSNEENSISGDMLEDLRAVYLPPLRDPAMGLRPSRTSQLARLIHRLSDEAAKEKIVSLVKKFDSELASERPVTETEGAVVKRHEAMLGPRLKQTLKVDLAPPNFQRIAARLSLAVQNLDVEQNGLGYNNLIYMAVVLSELQLNPTAAYKALIIEEPEAHLHPQLQAVLLEYFQSEDVPVQVFVTSHSPNFASIANLDALACIYQGATGVMAFFPRVIAFENKKKEKLQRYLDVTRAELFFARRIIIVEGTAELFMMAALARRVGIDLRKSSVSVLSTEGLNFDAFLPLFGPEALNVRLAVISDSDPPAETYPKLGDAPALSPAALSIQGKRNAFIEPFFALKTFEYDLALHPENHAAMLMALEDTNPVIAKELKIKIDATQPADKPRELFKGMFGRGEGKASVQKGAYGQALAQTITVPDVTFTVPPYIKAALEFIAKE